MALLSAIFLGLLSFAAAQRDIQPNCTTGFLTSILPSGVTLVRLDALKANSTYGEPGDYQVVNPAFPVQPSGLPAVCAVTLEVFSAPGLNSTHRVGLFLPLPSAWKSRTILTGLGGFAGGMNWLYMAPSTHMGFATATTDTGHISDAYTADWALNNIEKQTDWAWRAMHNTVNVTQAVVTRYYGREPKYRYYEGCSTSGRQGLKELQVDATSFDGVLIGAPAWWTKRMHPWATKVGLDNLPVDDPKHINVTQFTTLAREVVRQCDEVDGVKDGIVSLPDACTFDYEQIRCGGNGALNASTCFTELQIGVIKAALADWVDPDRENELLHPGMTLGAEDDWYMLMGGDEPSPFGPGYQRNFVYGDPNWAWNDGKFGPQAAYDADRLDLSNATADKYDLKEFRDRGGKMILYQGLGDALVVPKGSELYYNRVVEATSGGDLNKTRDFFRYFKIPGMSHCSTTAVDIGAPWAIGGPAQAQMFGPNAWSVPGFKDEKHDILQALIQWVEKDKPVDSVIATTWEDQYNVSTPVKRQRPICAAPFAASYNGEGDIDKADSWSCEIPQNSSTLSSSSPRSFEGSAASFSRGLGVTSASVTLLSIVLFSI